MGETLMISDEISVTVIEMNGNQVSISIAAPKEVGVYREEIYERIKINSHKEAARTKMSA